MAKGGGDFLSLDDIHEKAKHHAIIASIGFLVLLPIGVLIPRFTRTFNKRWFWGHWITQFLISGPFVLTGIGLGMNLTGKLQTGGHFVDPHKKAGLALLILYLVQITIGAIIHFFKTPRLMGGRRPPQNYFHAILGIAIITLAFWQVHYGITIEWTEGTTGVAPPSALRAWKAWIVVIFVLYFGGLALLPRQYRQERLAREGAMPEKVGMRDVEGNGSGEGLTHA